MKLSAFIVHELEHILNEWQRFARTILPNTQGVDTGRLRDDAREMLFGVA